jgi:hypothetical protein
MEELHQHAIKEAIVQRHQLHQLIVSLARMEQTLLWDQKVIAHLALLEVFAQVGQL